MSDDPKTQVDLQRERPEQAVALATAEPHIALIEVDTHLGLLLAQAVSEDELTGDLRFENVRVLRVPLGLRSLLADVRSILNQRSRPISSSHRFVTITKLGLIHIAKTPSGRILSDPSDLPYHVLPLRQRHYEVLLRASRADLVNHAEKLFGQIPGLKISRRRIKAPRGYARTTGKLVPSGA